MNIYSILARFKIIDAYGSYKITNANRHYEALRLILIQL